MTQPLSPRNSRSLRSPSTQAKKKLRAFSFLAALLSAPLAQAHHSPGHVGTESQKVLMTSGSEPMPRQRVALVGEMMRSTDEPNLNTATLGGFSLVGSIEVLPRLYLGAQLPLVFVQEASTQAPFKSGYGDTRLTSQWLFGQSADGSSAWSLGLNASLPTRTIRFESDPGNQWGLTPLLSYTHQYQKFRFFGMLLLPFESRPAGLALEVSPSAGAAYQVLQAFSLALSVHADIRMLSVCSTPRGSSVCQEGRASEHGRDWGATRVSGALTSWVDLSKNWSLFGSAQLPFTAKKDFEWGANLGLETRF